MKAAAFYEYGPAEAMQYADIPDPEIGPGDVLVQVQACGVNHSDLDSRAGTSRWPFELPMVLGAEFAGTVVGVGDHSGPFRPAIGSPRSSSTAAAGAPGAPGGGLISARPSRSSGPPGGAATASWSACRPR